MEPIDTELVARLYAAHRGGLDEARRAQRALLTRNSSMRAQLDDVEAEITYLLLRHVRPEVVVELGALDGWSTSWILRALQDNGSGKLRSYDLVDGALRQVPDELAGERWSFTRGDVRDIGPDVIAGADYLFIDADHGARFARWYTAQLLPALRSGTPVSVHDVFHQRWARPFGEGRVVLRWLVGRGIEPFTASRARAPRVYAQLSAVKSHTGLDDPVRSGRRNPMIFFRS
ncbi:MAG: class I SAM-dependent methyltransferase [Pseudonocardiaceae bacterium]|nr:class I SAM-dependent methyltransferase [Pseudonocardiaceae bacterium]